MKVIEIDSSNCIGCMSCVLACSLAKTKALSYKNAVMKIVKDEPKEICQIFCCSNCSQRNCIKACHFGAINMDENYNIPIIDYEKCTSCGLCARNCAYGIIKIESGSRKVYKCDFCGGSPSCALSCIPQAIKVKDTDMEGGETND